jgi:transposase-like protein
MKLSASEITQLRKLVAACDGILKKAGAGAESKGKTRSTRVASKRIRRSGKELDAFRKLLMTERKRGVPVAELAQKHGVSSAYIYMLK